MASPVLVPRVFRRRAAAAALVAAVATGGAVAVPAVASAEEAFPIVKIVQVHDGTIIADGAGAVVPVSYQCDGDVKYFSLNLVQRIPLGGAGGSADQAVECTGEVARVDVRVDAWDGNRYVRNASAMALVSTGLDHTMHVITLS